MRGATIAIALASYVAGAGVPAAWADDETLETRLQRLEDRAAIRELLIDYGRTLDARDFEAFAALFAEDGGTWSGGMGTAVGRDAIQKMMENSIGSDSAGMPAPNLHIFSNESIAVDGDTATARSKWIFAAGGEDGPRMIFIGHYDDRLVREGGDWKFALREVAADITAP